MITEKEYVVLVDEADREIGKAPKARVHCSVTPLHRAFSLFLFRKGPDLLIQQRAGSKKAWPLVWSNSCCGHPLPGESYEDAVIRRTRFELGIHLDQVWKISDYRYCFSRDGVMENEICPIYASLYDGTGLNPDPDEIQALRWIPWEEWMIETRLRPDHYSPWCVEETRILANALNQGKFRI